MGARENNLVTCPNIPGFIRTINHFGEGIASGMRWVYHHRARKLLDWVRDRTPRLLAAKSPVCIAAKQHWLLSDVIEQERLLENATDVGTTDEAHGRLARKHKA